MIVLWSSSFIQNPRCANPSVHTCGMMCIPRSCSTSEHSFASVQLVAKAKVRVGPHTNMAPALKI